MAIRYNTAMQNLLADAKGDAFNSGTLNIYTGTQPASANDAASGTLLATINLPADAFSAASSGSASKAGTWSATVSTSGTAGWARMINSGATLRVDGSVGTSGTDWIIDNASLVSGGTVTVTAATITQPAS